MLRCLVAMAVHPGHLWYQPTCNPTIRRKEQLWQGLRCSNATTAHILLECLRSRPTATVPVQGLLHSLRCTPATAVTDANQPNSRMAAREATVIFQGEGFDSEPAWWAQPIARQTSAYAQKASRQPASMCFVSLERRTSMGSRLLHERPLRLGTGPAPSGHRVGRQFFQPPLAPSSTPHIPVTWYMQCTMCVLRTPGH